jgi:hypothetical protein
MKIRFLLGFLVPAALVPMAAFADDRAACLDAVSKGQRLRDMHKLVEAREQLRVCAALRCPAVVRTDCTDWLAEVDKALPTVVVTAKSGAGADLVDVKVSVDGQPLVSKLDGQAVPMNAGPHTFHFEGVDGTRIDQHVMVREGEKNQAVAAVLGAAPVTHTGSLGAASPAPSGTSSSPRKTVGWVLGGAGVVGLGVGTVLGIIAALDKSAHCDANDQCDPGGTARIRREALVSDVGWTAGGILLAGGAALVLFAPGASHEPTAAVRVAPAVTASGGGIAVGGSW